VEQLPWQHWSCSSLGKVCVPAGLHCRPAGLGSIHGKKALWQHSGLRWGAQSVLQLRCLRLVSAVFAVWDTMLCCCLSSCSTSHAHSSKVTPARLARQHSR
jgi:hypothetical protein